ncbi:MAG TPA: ABC transporter permease [Planctomycetaceae bacterium]|jgi:ABC-type antimicrobial peptide transport system permease subunit|nr:ABC transporter permease [Planctomycetaceae bacterium]
MHFLLRTPQMAVSALRRHVLRSVLTTLGIVIGVGAVIAMVEIGDGAAREVEAAIASMGSNTILVLPGNLAMAGVAGGAGSAMSLTPGDALAMAEHCSALVAVAPLVAARTQVVANGRNWVPDRINGTTPAYLEIREWDRLDGGSMFSDEDVTALREVCVVGQTVADELFGDESPVGQQLRMNNRPLKILGVLSRKGANMYGQDQDDIVILPWTTLKFKVVGQSAQKANQSAALKVDPSQQVNSLNDAFPSLKPVLYPVASATQLADTPNPVHFTNLDLILVKAGADDLISPAMRQIQELLRERHHRRAGQPEDFTLRDMTEISRTRQSTSRLMSVLLLVVAMISLVVGGVGIMNIMLVSVSERTKEIGVRMAIGARSRDILQQFLVESLLLCALGGATGILLGRVSSFVVRATLLWPTRTSWPAMFAAVGVSLLIGVVFGFYPAWKASRLDPIEALRYE